MNEVCAVARLFGNRCRGMCVSGHYSFDAKNIPSFSSFKNCSRGHHPRNDCKQSKHSFTTLPCPSFFSFEKKS